MNILSVILRTLFFYFFIMLIYRIMGKREVGQLGIIDLIVSILIAELVAISIENLDKSIFETIIPIVILGLLEIGLAFLSIKSIKFRNLFDGKPSLIINRGQVNYHEMIKQRYSLDDLLFQLRNKNIKSIEDVEYAILETNGELSIFKYAPFKIPTRYPLPLIMDGALQLDTLKNIHKTETWLRDELRKKEITYQEVFYAYYKSKTIYVIKKQDLI